LIKTNHEGERQTETVRQIRCKDGDKRRTSREL